MTANTPKKPRMSLSGKILLGMGLGIPVGLFFGEEVAFLNFAGEAFVQLLQVSILPFVLVSLIVGLGKLTYDQAIALAKKGGAPIGDIMVTGSCRCRCHAPLLSGLGIGLFLRAFVG